MMDINPPNWLCPLMLVIGGAFIFWSAFLALRERIISGNSARYDTSVMDYPQGVQGILSIERQEPKNVTPLWITIIGEICAIIMFLVAMFQTYLIIAGKITMEFNWQLILFYIFFGILPVLMIFEPFNDNKYYKTGKSSTAVEVIYKVRGNIQDIFSSCFTILEMMNSKGMVANANEIIKAKTNKARISIKLQTDNDNVEIRSIFDALWVNVKYGKGNNLKAADEFQRHLFEILRKLYKNEISQKENKLNDTQKNAPLVLECNSYQKTLVGDTYLNEPIYLWALDAMLTNASDNQSVSTKAVSLQVNYLKKDGNISSYTLPLISDSDKEKYGDKNKKNLEENEYLRCRESRSGIYQFLDEQHHGKPHSMQTWPTLTILDSFSGKHQIAFNRPSWLAQLNSGKEKSLN